MKKWLICSLFAMGVLVSGAMVAAQEKGEGKKRPTTAQKGPRGGRADANAPRVADANAGARRNAFRATQEARIRRLEGIKLIAAGENATKTVAEIDKLIADEKKQLARMSEARKKAGEGKKRGSGKDAGSAGTPVPAPKSARTKE